MTSKNKLCMSLKNKNAKTLNTNKTIVKCKTILLCNRLFVTFVDFLDLLLPLRDNDLRLFFIVITKLI